MHISHLHHCKTGQICVAAYFRDPLLKYNISIKDSDVWVFSLCSTDNILPYPCEGAEEM